MTKWEYRLVEIPYGPHESPIELEQLGDQGWEAVGMSIRELNGADASPVRNRGMLTVLMKRQKAETGQPRIRNI